MDWNKHFSLAGQHAFLSASKYHWINYDEEKLDASFRQAMMAKRGSELHALAHDLIRLKVKLPKNSKTLNLYVNDALGYRMASEQVLYYSPNAFGTADAISFSESTMTLRISDLKTGVTNTSEKQLLVYAALFCLEYDYSPLKMNIELRIYQNDECRVYIADPTDVVFIMEKIKLFDKRINALREE